MHAHAARSRAGRCVRSLEMPRSTAGTARSRAGHHVRSPELPCALVRARLLPTSATLACRQPHALIRSRQARLLEHPRLQVRAAMLIRWSRALTSRSSVCSCSSTPLRALAGSVALAGGSSMCWCSSGCVRSPEQRALVLWLRSQVERAQRMEEIRREKMTSIYCIEKPPLYRLVSIDHFLLI